MQRFRVAQNIKNNIVKVSVLDKTVNIIPSNIRETLLKREKKECYHWKIGRKMTKYHFLGGHGHWKYQLTAGVVATTSLPNTNPVKPVMRTG